MAHTGIVRLAIEIDRLVEPTPGRRAIEGNILLPGNDVHDTYVGKPVPVESYGNPVRRHPCEGSAGATESRVFVAL